MTDLRARGFLLAWVAAGVWAFSSAYQTPAWILLAPAALSLVWRPRSAPAFLRRWLPYVTGLGLAAVAVVGLVVVTYPAFSPSAEQQFFLRAGWIAGALAAILLVGSNIWDPAAALIPAAVGLLVIACFRVQTSPPYAAVAVAGVAAFSYLARDQRQAWRLILAAGGTVAVAWTIVAWLPWAQGRVEQIGASMIAPEVGGASGTESRLGEFDRLKRSKRIVMRVWTERPQKLRGRVLVRFDGKMWTPARPFRGTLMPSSESASGAGATALFEDVPGNVFRLPDRPAAAPATGLIRTRVVRVGLNDGIFMAPAHKEIVVAPVDRLLIDRFANVGPWPGSAAEVYGVVSADLSATVDERPEVIADALVVPDTTDPRLGALASELTAQAATPEERVRRTVQFVSGACIYSLDIGPFRTSQPVAEFLFEKKRGYCQYFASAAAILLRLQGVPARYVTGFNVTELNRQGAYYVVREADAHAWIEAYVPGRGWVEADPTPATEFESLHEEMRSGLLGDAWEWLAGRARDAWATMRAGGWRWLLAVMSLWITAGGQAALTHWWVTLVLLAALVTAAAIARRRGRAGHAGRRLATAADVTTPPAEVIDLMEQLDETWARAGCARPASRAPLEHCESLAARLGSDVHATSRTIVECFYRACFAGEIPAPSEVRELKSKL